MVKILRENEMKANNYALIFWTAPDSEEAMKIARLLVEARLVACASVVKEVQSLFLWKGEIENATESKVIFKTKASHFEKIKKTILENCRYEVPEILMVAIDSGSESYLRWIDETVQ